MWTRCWLPHSGRTGHADRARQAEASHRDSCAAVANLVPSLMFVHPFGIEGVATGTLMGNGLTVIPYTRLPVSIFDASISDIP